VVVAFALVARALGTVSVSGVVAGIAVGCAVLVFGGPEAFALLALFFVLGSAATRMGYQRKARRGVAEAGRGARGAVHVVANGGAAAFLAFLAASTDPPLRDGLLLAFTAALATAACDTLGSEVGPLGHGEPFLVTRWRRVPAGTPGAVSSLGTATGVAGALAVGAAAAALGSIPAAAIPIVAAAALFGMLLESVLAATLERRGIVDSETVNFLNTVAGALAALGLARLAGGWG
jgi:uncharacterized protein (TIGR00297 family)